MSPRFTVAKAFFSSFDFLLEKSRSARQCIALDISKQSCSSQLQRRMTEATEENHVFGYGSKKHRAGRILVGPNSDCIPRHAPMKVRNSRRNTTSFICSTGNGYIAQQVDFGWTKTFEDLPEPTWQTDELPPCGTTDKWTSKTGSSVAVGGKK